MSEKPLFQDADEQEARYAPEQVPGDGVSRSDLDEHGAAAFDTGLTPVAVPMGTGGSAGAVPASEEFEPGMEREAHDLAQGDPVTGRDHEDDAT